MPPPPPFIPADVDVDGGDECGEDDGRSGGSVDRAIAASGVASSVDKDAVEDDVAVIIEELKDVTTKRWASTGTL